MRRNSPGKGGVRDRGVVLVEVGVAGVDGGTGVEEPGEEDVVAECFGAVEGDEGGVGEDSVVVEDEAEGEFAGELEVDFGSEDLVVEDGGGGVGEAGVDPGFVEAEAGGGAEGEREGGVGGVCKRGLEAGGGVVVDAGAVEERAGEGEPLEPLGFAFGVEEALVEAEAIEEFVELRVAGGDLSEAGEFDGEGGGGFPILNEAGAVVVAVEEEMGAVTDEGALFGAPAVAGGGVRPDGCPRGG